MINHKTTTSGNIAMILSALGALCGGVAIYGGQHRWGVGLALAGTLLGNIANGLGNRQSQDGAP